MGMEGGNFSYDGVRDGRVGRTTCDTEDDGYIERESLRGAMAG